MSTFLPKKMHTSILIRQLVCLFMIFAFISLNTVQATTYVVSVTTKGDDGYAPSPNGTNTLTTGTANTLGWAIASANAHAGADTITFNMPANTVLNISNPNWYLFTDAAGAYLDATIGGMAAAWSTAGSCKPIIALNGNGNGYNPITLASNTTIKGLVFYGIAQVILMNNVTNCKVQGCYFGTDLTGTVVNATGGPQQAIIVSGTSSLNLIGGVGCSQRNVFSGAYSQGIEFKASATLNAISGNYIGVDATGLVQLYTASSVQGIYFTGAGPNNLISNNVISGYYNNNSYGIEISSTNNTVITGNYVGVDKTGGNSTFSNTVGIATDGSSVKTKIGWYGAGNGNVVANSTYYGINCTASTADSLYIINNYVGTNSSGAINAGYSAANRFGNDRVNTTYGASNININTFTNVLVINNVIADAGPKTSGAAGISTSYGSVGVGIIFTGVSNATIQGNMIGVDVTGNTALGNEDNGMSFVSPCSNILVGGPLASQKNVIGANGYKNGAIFPYIQHGVQTTPGGTFSNFTFQNNNVGIGLNGTTNVGNYNMGLGLWSITNLTVMNNLISNNIWGLFMDNVSPGLVYSNTITNNDDLVANQEGSGIGVQGSASKLIQIGSPSLGGNTIYNNKNGIWLRSDGTDAAPSLITIRNNTIYSNNGIPGVRQPAEFGGAPGPYGNANGGNGIAISAANSVAGNNIIGGTGVNFQNKIYKHNNNGSNVYVNGTTNGNGVYIWNSYSNLISENSIYCNSKAGVNGINLNLGGSPGNTGITITPFTVGIGNYITATTPGIQLTNTPGTYNASDTIQVFYDPDCGTCQGQIYLGNGTLNGVHSAWSFSPLPAGSTCTTTGPQGSATCLDGVNNITATRTDANSNTSQFISCSPNVLPVTIIMFTANTFGKNSAQLLWTTAVEKNNAYFEISRSYDGKTFTPIGIVDGNGNTITAHNYEFIDNGVEGPIVYYMLTQVDMDGTQTISGIRQVNIDLNAQIIVSSFQGGIKVLNNTGSNFVKISLITAAGAEVMSTTSFDSETETSFSTNGLATGVYLVKVLTEAQLTTKKSVIY